MKTVGIIAEFNPFHNGHKYMIEKAKAMTGADTAVVIMSGDFVQRGAPAVCDKYLRTRMALACGADIVFELPAVYALGSAEQFAYGGVKLLSSTLNIDAICFGSECGNIEELEDFAIKAEEFSGTLEFKSMMASFVKQGLSYPSAFEKVMAENPKWLNVSVKDQDILFDLNGMVLKVKNDLVAIHALNSEIEEQCIDTYANFGNDLSMAIQRNSQYLADKQKVVEQVKEQVKEQPAPVEVKSVEQPSQKNKVHFIVSIEDAEEVENLLNLGGITFEKE